MLIKFSVPIVVDDDASPSFWANLWKPKDAQIEQVVTRHLRPLATKRMQTLVKNEYGKYAKKEWASELSYFLMEVLIPEMPWWHSLRQEPPSQRALTRAARIVDDVVATECKRLRQNFRDDQVPQDGPEYERYCRTLLENYGWQVQLTKGSYDQGVDLLGQHLGKTVAFQCKRYAQPVGNQAVQEVVAGRVYYKADVAAVITNAEFTSAAKKLATVSNVHLLHHSDLPEFARRIH